MNIDSEDLVHQFAQDWPDQFQHSRQTVLIARLSEENEQLRAEVERLTTAPPPPYAGAFGLGEEARHG